MYAVFEDRNKQHKAAPGERICIDFNAQLEPGSTVTFDKVCAVGGDNGRVGTPYVDGASVTAKVIGEVKGPKLIVQWFRRRKASKTRTGYRARYTEIQIDSIDG